MNEHIVAKRPKRVGIVGCGAIFPAHVEAIEGNRELYRLVAVCDIDGKALKKARLISNATPFNDFRKMLIQMKGKMDMVTIATPTSLHYSQAIKALDADYDVLIEKPICFRGRRALEIARKAEEMKKQAYAVLQVRYNHPVQLLKQAVNDKVLGEIRLVSLVQRWQRPREFFSSWRGNKKIGGRTLYEVGIHYLDVMQWIFGIPKVLSTHTFNLKYKQIAFEDTVFSTLLFKSGTAGSIEVTVAAEPSNLECSLSVIGEKGSIKIGGVAMNKIEYAEFLEIDPNVIKLKKEIAKVDKPSPTYSRDLGSSPNHPVLYRKIAQGEGISIEEASKSIKFIEEIYKVEGKHDTC